MKILQKTKNKTYAKVEQQKQDIPKLAKTKKVSQKTGNYWKERRKFLWNLFLFLFYSACICFFCCPARIQCFEVCCVFEVRTSIYLLSNNHPPVQESTRFFITCRTQPSFVRDAMDEYFSSFLSSLFLVHHLSLLHFTTLCVLLFASLSKFFVGKQSFFPSIRSYNAFILLSNSWKPYHGISVTSSSVFRLINFVFIQDK